MIDADELRLIAEETHLTPADRELLKAAAHHIERLEEMVIETQRDLIESQGHRIALNEQLLEARRFLVLPPQQSEPVYQELVSGLVWCDNWWRTHQLGNGMK